MSTLPLQFLIQVFARVLLRDQRAALEYVLEENRVLREMIGKKRLDFTDAQRRRLAAKAKALSRRALMKLAAVAHPDTILRWYRSLIGQKYDGTAQRGPGRPRITERLENLIVRIAKECPKAGYTRIVGLLKLVGEKVSRTTVQRVLREHGIDPAPKRGKYTKWSTFLKAHWEGMAACDFFTVGRSVHPGLPRHTPRPGDKALTFFGLVRYHVFFVIHLSTRKVEIAGITPSPSGAYMAQVARNLTDCEDGFLKDKCFLIMDRDPLYTTQFRKILGSTGVKSVRLPAKSPDLNAYAERFVRTIKEECLSRIVPLGEEHLRRCIFEFESFYHEDRPHQGLGNVLIVEPERWGTGEIRRRTRLGGLLNSYYRAAA